MDEVESIPDRIVTQELWNNERWWYKLAHVCRRWRHLILASASHLHLHLVCTYDTPVADMLAHSPHLPLIIDYFHGNRDISTEDGEGIALALQHHDRVRLIRLMMPFPSLQEPIKAIDEEFPILECLCIMPLTKPNTSLVLPKTLQAPHLRYLLLGNFTSPIGSPLLSTVVNLITLILGDIHILSSADFHPNDILQRLSLLPQLQTLWFNFHSFITNHDVERQLLHTPVVTHATLPNLRRFAFGGASAYLEALLPHMTTPVLERLRIEFFSQFSFSIPHLPQFLSTIENIRFSSATLTFDESVFVSVYPHVGAEIDSLSMRVRCRDLNWQVASVAQILDELRIVSSVVECLTLDYRRDSISPEWHNEADRSQWRELLRPFSKVKLLRVPDSLVGAISRSLQPEEGESPLEVLPELEELSCSRSSNTRDPFTVFIDSRRIAGHPVSLVDL